MNKISLHWPAFIKTLLFFLIFTVLWTIFCKSVSELTSNGLVFITSLGFLVLFPVSIYMGMGRGKLKALATTLVATIFIFVAGSFIIGPLVSLISGATILYAVTNSCFVAVSMTLVFDKCYGIKFRYFTMGLAFISLLLAYYMINWYNEAPDRLFDIHPRFAMFNIFQGLMLIPLLLGITTGTAEKNTGSKQEHVER